MNGDFGFFDYAVTVVSCLMALIPGVRMLVDPGGLRKNSLMYRYMVNRHFKLLDKGVAETGKLTHTQIRLYGLVLTVLGLSFLLIMVLPVG